MSRNGSGTFNLLVNSWSPAVNGVAATAADWQALINDVASGLTQSVSKDGQTTMTGNLPMGGFKLTNLAAGTAAGNSLRWEQLFSQGAPATVASAATTDIGLQNSVAVEITGTTTITSFGTNYNGPRFLRFTGALILTHSASLALPGAANITTVAGDTCIAYPNSAGTGWNVVQFQRAASLINGAAASGANSDITSLTGLTTPLSQAQGGTGTALATRQIAQSLSTSSGASASGTTTIPLDNTKPQITEGTQFLSLAFTAKSASSTLEFEAVLALGHSVSTAVLIGAVFDTQAPVAADAIGCGVAQNVNNGGISQVVIKFRVSASTTTSRTFTVRAGSPTAGTIYLNDNATGVGVLNGTLVSSLTVTEYLP